MCLAKHRPFLSKNRADFTRTIGEINWQIEYVLNNPRLLIIGFFDEKRVVLDTLRKWLDGVQCAQR